jgi:inhibitor of the pro-sigma K processing machinery
MDLKTGLQLALGIGATLLLLHRLARPMEVLLRLLGSSILGGLAIWALNQVAGQAGWQIGLNPASALLVGLLGLPGLAGLIVLRFVLG